MNRILLLCLLGLGALTLSFIIMEGPSKLSPENNRVAVTDLSLEQIRDELKQLGVIVVPPRTLRNGFVIGGPNKTETIRALSEINGKTISELERVMRPGQLSDAGFLGNDEHLLDVMAADNEYVTDWGLTHRALSKCMFDVSAILAWQRKNNQLGNTFSYQGQRFTGHLVWWWDFQASPFADSSETNADVSVTNLENGTTLWFSLLVPVMIERYGFYEGKGTTYRVEPKRIVQVFDFLRNERRVK